MEKKINLPALVQHRVEIVKKDNANVIMFPPLLYAITMVIAIVADDIFSILRLPWQWSIIGWPFVIAGLIFLAAAVRLFNKNKTTINPSGSSTAIVSSGIYNYSRNPMYIAFTLIYIGAMLFNRSGLGLLLIIPLLIIVQKGIIEREEKYLLQKFGKTYYNYKMKVRRWL